MILSPPQVLTVSGPLIFLAGPIQGSADWQEIACQEILKIDASIHIANPRRQYFDHAFVYADQVDWESTYLDYAGRMGVILFWLAREVEHDINRAYAQTTRFELGEWYARLGLRGPERLIVGIEEGFTGARYVLHRLSQNIPPILTSNSLSTTCAAAVLALQTLYPKGLLAQ